MTDPVLLCPECDVEHATHGAGLCVWLGARLPEIPPFDESWARARSVGAVLIETLGDGTVRAQLFTYGDDRLTGSVSGRAHHPRTALAIALYRLANPEIDESTRPAFIPPRAPFAWRPSYVYTPKA